MVDASAFTRTPPPKGAGHHARLRSVLCQKQHNPPNLPLVSITRNYFFPIGGIAPWAVRQQVMPDDHSESVPPLPIPNRTVKRRHADDSADYPCESRSSSGSPAADRNPTPKRWGFCVYQPLHTALTEPDPRENPTRIRLGAFRVQARHLIHAARREPQATN